MAEKVDDHEDSDLNKLCGEMEAQMDQTSSFSLQDLDRENLPYRKLFRDIRLQISVGLKLHQAKRVTTDAQFLDLYTELNILIDTMEDYQQTILKNASKFDFINYNGEPVKANGYRSLLNVLKSLLTHLMDHLHKYARERNKKFSNIAESLSNIVSYVRALQGLEKICRIVIALMTISDPPVLYNTREMKNCICLLLCSESINRDVYYGRCLGFQYSQGLKPILQFLAIAMASYEEWYKGSKEDPVKQLFSSLLNGGKYIQHPTQRGVKIADLTEDCSIDFTKAFWSITEQTAITTVAKFVSLNVDVSECIEVPAKDISVLSSLTGESVQIRPPFSDLGYKPVPLTLISFKHRDGQKSSRYGHRTTLPPSYALVIHFHGGGFVAQSSKSHEFYLRFWSRDLDCPILSVDYSLAPDGCYPRNLDECVFAYAWALNNFSILGTTGEKIILAGDSTGGYFAITTAMKIKQLGLRMPDEVFAFYPPTMLSSLPTPSRFLSFMDTLLPIGILISCLQAFAGMNPSDELRNKRKMSVRRILKAKGYIIPSIVNPYVTPKAQSRFEKLADGFQRKKKSSSIDEASKDSTKSPPPRPPPPKSSISVKPKPERPPPPSRQSTTGSISETPFDNIEDKVEDIAEPSHAKNDSQLTGQSLTDVDLDTTTYESENFSNDDISVFDNPLMSVSPFFPKQNSSEGLRFGMKVPDKKDCMSEAEVDALLEEVMSTVDEPDDTLSDPFKCPPLAPDDYLIGLPKVNIIVCSLDPLMDDGIIMAQRLKSLKQPVTLTVMDELSHGFLNLAGTELIKGATSNCLTLMKNALK